MADSGGTVKCLKGSMHLPAHWATSLIHKGLPMGEGPVPGLIISPGLECLQAFSYNEDLLNPLGISIIQSRLCLCSDI